MVGGLNSKTKRGNDAQTKKDPNTALLEKELSDVLGSPVEIKHNKKGKGKLIVSFKSLEALQGVIEKIK